MYVTAAIFARNIRFAEGGAELSGKSFCPAYNIKIPGYQRILFSQLNCLLSYLDTLFNNNCLYGCFAFFRYVHKNPQFIMLFSRY